MVNLSGLELDSSSSAAERVFGSGQLIEVIKVGQTRDHIDRYAPEITLPGEYDRQEIGGSIGEKREMTWSSSMCSVILTSSISIWTSSWS